MQNKEEKILAFRKAFLNLPEDSRDKEVTRVYNITKGIPFVVLEDSDIGKVIKFLDVASLIEYFWREKQIRVDKSFIYKVLRGQHKTAYGYKVYFENIE